MESFDLVLETTPEDRIPNNLNISFTGVENLQPGIAVSACTTGQVETSQVLQAITDDEDRWHNAIRVGFGKDNTLEEI